MDDYEPRFKLSEIAKVTDVSANTVRAWFHRGHIRYLETDATAEGAGLAHRLSMRSALRIGCVKALVDLGVHPAQADIAALHWLDLGDEERAPGALFDPNEKYMTVLWVFPSGSHAVRSIEDSIFPLLDGAGVRQPGGTMLILNYIDQRVRGGLEAAYGDAD